MRHGLELWKKKMAKSEKCDKNGRSDSLFFSFSPVFCPPFSCSLDGRKGLSKYRENVYTTAVRVRASNIARCDISTALKLEGSKYRMLK